MKTGFVAVVALVAAAGSAQAGILGPGSIAFTGFNADGNDDLGFVALADIAGGTEIYFTDNEFLSGAFNAGESFTRYVAPAGGIAAGTVVTFSNFTAGTTANVGTLAPMSVSGSTNRGISNGADTIYAYLGTSATAPTAFLAAVSNAASGTDDFALAGTGLAAGSTAIGLPSSTDGGRYTGGRAGLNTFDGYLALVNNAANWETTTGDGTAYVPFDTTAFTVVPAPGTLALLGVGGLVARRRR